MDGYQPGRRDGRAWQDRDPYRERQQYEQRVHEQRVHERFLREQQLQVRSPRPPALPAARPAARPRTPALAVLLSFLWLGAGNCYAGQVGLGVTLVLAQVVCVPVAALLAGATFGLSLLLTVPLWIAASAGSAASAHHRCREDNRALGLPR